MSNDQTNAPDRIIREPERREITGISRSAWWKYEKIGEVPKSRFLVGRAKGWRLSEILAWMESRKQEAA